jgi:hypothetical protein
MLVAHFQFPTRSSNMKSSAPRQPTRRRASLVSTVSIVLTAGLIGLLPACSWWSSAPRSDTSVGKELATLREAYAKGTITKEEYERERHRIIGDW